MAVPSPAPTDSPACPSCHAPLVLGANGQAAFWSCPNGHGVACTVTAAYGRVQEDEIARIWHGSEQAAAGSRACPMCGKPMVEVAAGVDADQVKEGDPGDGADTATVSVDVCREDEVFWLDAGELDQLPQDTPDAQPSEQELRNIEAVRQTFIAGVDEGLRAQQSTGVLNHLANLVAGRHPAFSSMLTPSPAVAQVPVQTAPAATPSPAAATPDANEPSDQLA
jgi:Zn-finger nucleic acid-binding protein